MPPRKPRLPVFNVETDGTIEDQSAQDFTDELKMLYAEIARESDRAAAVLSAASLDLLLHRLLRDFLVDDPKECDELLGDEDTGGNKPLSTFSSKIRAAYCMGLIGHIERHDLDLIRRIRNDFAHHLHGLTFSSEHVNTRCLQLETPVLMHGQPQSGPRRRFLVATYFLSYAIMVRQMGLRTDLDLQKQQRRVVPEDIAILFARWGRQNQSHPDDSPA